MSRCLSQGTMNKLGNEKTKTGGKWLRTLCVCVCFICIVQKSMQGDMNYLFKTILPRLLHICSTACAGVGDRDFGSAKPMGYSSLSANPTRGQLAAAGTTSQLCPGAGCVAQQLHVHLIPTSFFAHCLHFRTPQAQGEIPLAPTAQTSSLAGAIV